MPSFSQGDVLRVPFPYVERPVLQRRPAVVISAGEIAGAVPLLWVAMVTSAENRAWPGDISLAETHSRFGLPHPCVIRPAKIATLEARGLDRVGALDSATLGSLLRAVLSVLQHETDACGSTLTRSTRGG